MNKRGKSIVEIKGRTSFAGEGEGYVREHRDTYTNNDAEDETVVPKFEKQKADDPEVHEFDFDDSVEILNDEDKLDQQLDDDLFQSKYLEESRRDSIAPNDILDESIKINQLFLDADDTSATSADIFSGMKN